ncbi:trypsin-like peptidase domain-containing protein [Starkeya sp. ORNL1]|uniref:trypsin-like serine peptidase n=1 Tax=Starkeya sp. ORNL1 TaxID=2709380 RepID=UPI001462F12D|nr:serine protease [Starkeya sp. ORNL1]QJP14613.1 trypsin-like peptidase domain-containing protein [Starkeya sp. ORNL1]
MLPLLAAQAQSCPDVLEPTLKRRFDAALAAKDTEAKPIYGCDDRRNFYDPVLTEHERKAAQATAVLVSRGQLKSADEQKTKWYLQPRPDALKLCSPEDAVANNRLAPERFWDEPLPGNCSAFKVGKRWMATAGHCIKTRQQCSDTAFVFGFHMREENDAPDKGIPSERIYRCVKIIAGEYSGDSDWRIVEVDRDINGPQVDIRTKTTTSPPRKGTALTVVGYPLGLPVKIAGGADVHEIHKRYLTANLDTYHGSSGSVVLNSDRLKQGQLLAEGILVRGETDFVPGLTCSFSEKCPGDGCRREDVTLTSEFAHILKK